MTTPKTLRTPPARTFNDYVLTYDRSARAGLTCRNYELFTEIIPGGVSSSFDLAADNGVQSIGFTFNFNEVNYTKMAVTSFGYLVLADPTLSANSTIEVCQRVLTDVELNTSVSSSIMNNDVLLSPWFDTLVTRYDDTVQMVSDAMLTQAQVDDIAHGVNTPPTSLSTNGGVFIRKCDISELEGRRTIVRWNTCVSSSVVLNNNPLEFECVLYESGKVEFRYAPLPQRNKSSYSTTEHAVCGVFVSGSNNFRDFSTMYTADWKRRPYVLGGSTYAASFADPVTTSTAYVHSLTSNRHWFGHAGSGGLLEFVPPKNRRKILPRRAIRDLDNQETYPQSANVFNNALSQRDVVFDDRKSLVFGEQEVVNYPSTLPRFYRDSLTDASSTQDMFSGEFLVSSSVSKNAIDQFLQTQRQYKACKPFVEHMLYEQGNTGSYYMTGSDLNTGGLNFTNPLSSKTRLTLSLPIKHKTQLQEASASIVYYNKTSKKFDLVAKNDLTNPIPTIQTFGSASTYYRTQDFKGFDPLGRTVVSGYPFVYNQTYQYAGQNYQAYVSRASSQRYDKSLFTNPDYHASKDLTFELPINKPFLIEKAVIKLPIEAGPGWFNDRTTVRAMSAITYDWLGLGILDATDNADIDVAGPQLTLSLMVQHSNKPNESYRDVVLTGTIDHLNDLTSSVIIEQVQINDFANDTADVWKTAFIRGRNGYELAPPTHTIVSSSGFFTGTVTLVTEPAVSNGVQIAFDVLERFVTPQTLFTTQYVNDYIGVGFPRLAQINPFGRAAIATPSGRSILGKEYTTSNDVSSVSLKNIRNPFYVGSTIPSYLNVSDLNAFTITSLEKSSHSPYLVLPGDKLVLAISKCHPELTTSAVIDVEGVGGVHVFSQYDYKTHHDIKISTGTIDITLYGSLVKEGKEYHEPLQQELWTEAVHESVIGNEPILDQFDVEYMSMLSGTYVDEYVTGSLVTKTVLRNFMNRSIITTGSRGRVFSNVNASVNATPFNDGNALYSSKYIFSSEYAQNTRTLRFKTENETFYDSLLPSVDGILSAENAKMYSVGIPPMLEVMMKPAILILGYSAGLTDIRNWIRAFPFESKYDNASRVIDVSKTFISVNAQGKQSIAKTVAFVDYTVYDSYFGDTVYSGLDSDFANLRSSTDTFIKYFFGIGTGFSSSFGMPSAISTSFVNSKIEQTSEYGNVYSNPIVRGWKYGLYNGFKTNSSVVFRRDRFGQPRDMLEQRLDTKFFYSVDQNTPQSVGSSPVTIKFVDANGDIIPPENTTTSNLSLEATSSLPFFDNTQRNRPDLNPVVINKNILTLNQSMFRNFSVL